jgi:uncharacterized protein (TIGR03437 family)
MRPRVIHHYRRSGTSRCHSNENDKIATVGNPRNGSSRSFQVLAGPPNVHRAAGQADSTRGTISASLQSSSRLRPPRRSQAGLRISTSSKISSRHFTSISSTSSIHPLIIRRVKPSARESRRRQMRNSTWALRNWSPWLAICTQPLAPAQLSTTDPSPLTLCWLDDGLFVTAAAPKYKQALATQIVAVNGLPIDQVTILVGTAFAYSNGQHLHESVANRLTSLFLLQGLDIIPYGSNAPITFGLGETRVLFDGIPAPLLWTVRGSIAAVVPDEVPVGRTSSVVVQYGGRRSVAVRVEVRKSDPALFTRDRSGKDEASMLNQTRCCNSENNPAPRGSIAQLYATGAGQTSPAGITVTSCQHLRMLPTMPSRSRRFASFLEVSPRKCCTRQPLRISLQGCLQ